MDERIARCLLLAQVNSPPLLFVLSSQHCRRESQERWIVTIALTLPDALRRSSSQSNCATVSLTRLRATFHSFPVQVRNVLRRTQTSSTLLSSEERTKNGKIFFCTESEINNSRRYGNYRVRRAYVERSRGIRETQS